MLRRFDEVDQSQLDAQKKARKRMIIMAVASVVLVALLFTALLVTSNGDSKSTKDSSNGEMVSSVASTTKIQNTLKSICNVTLYPSSCVESLHPLVNSSESVNLTTIFRYSLQVVIDELKVASMKLDNLEVGNGTSFFNVKALNNCKDLVILALEKLNQTVGTPVDFSSKLIVDDMETWLSSVITYQGTCIDGFQNGTVDFRSFIGYTLNNSTEMASNSLAVLRVAAKLLDGLHLRRRRKLMSFGENEMPSWAAPRFRRLLQFGGLGNNSLNGGRSVGDFGNQFNGGNLGGGGNSLKPWNGDFDGNFWNPFRGKNGGNGAENGTGSSGAENGAGSSGDENVAGSSGAEKGTGSSGANEGGSSGEGNGRSRDVNNGGGGANLGSDSLKPALVVAADGSGDHTTISAAVAAVPEKNTAIFIIYVKEGTYLENVDISSKKWNILMYGDGKDKTIVSGGLNAVDGTPTYSSATFSVKGKGFMVKDMGFYNTAGAVKHQAVAFLSDSDMSVYYRSRFDAYQDTLYAHTGRQFYKDCEVTGTVDFIFGNAAQVLQNCNILPRKPMDGQKNAITAQGRTDPNQNTGISIQKSKIGSDDDLSTVEVYLGRPWKDYAATVYITSYLPAFVRPEGWMAWTSGVTPPSTIVYGEYKNEGPGAAIGGRVAWKGVSSEMTVEAANMFTVKTLLNGDRWIPKSGISYILGL